MSKPEVIHFAIGQRYPGVREDGRRVEMVQIMCQEHRVFLPRGHKATHSQDMGKLSCRRCLEALMVYHREQMESAASNMATAVDDRTEFKISRRARGQIELQKWFGRHREKPDPEIMERLKYD